MQGLVPELEGKTVVIPLCGGNVDTPLLGRVLERGYVYISIIHYCIHLFIYFLLEYFLLILVLLLMDVLYV